MHEKMKISGKHCLVLPFHTNPVCPFLFPNIYAPSAMSEMPVRSSLTSIHKSEYCRLTSVHETLLLSSSAALLSTLASNIC